MPKPLTINIQIPKPCNENWDDMTPDNSGCGRFCDSCSKTVIDFSLLSDTAVANILKQSSAPICGRFHASQLNRDIFIPEEKKHKPLHSLASKIAASFLLLQTLAANVFAQSTTTTSTELSQASVADDESNVIITGTITDNTTGAPLIGMEISIEGLSYVKYSDAKGQFKFVLPKSFRGKNVFIDANYTQSGSKEMEDYRIRAEAIPIPTHPKQEITVELQRYPFQKMPDILIVTPAGATFSGEVHHTTTVTTEKKQTSTSWIKKWFGKKK